MLQRVRVNGWRGGRIIAVATLGLMVLAGCGGDDDDNGPVATAIPAPETTGTAGAQVVIVGDVASTPAATDQAPASPGGGPRRGSPGPGQDANADGTPRSAAGSPVITLTDFRVNARRTSYRLGRTFNIEVQNNGAEPHSFVIERKGATNQPLEAGGKIAKIESIAPGEKATLTWVFTEAGDYQFACHKEDHYELGMVLGISVAT